MGSNRARVALVAVYLVLTVLLSGATVATSRPASLIPDASGFPTPIRHVIVVVLENANRSDVLSEAPYESYLAKSYAQASGFFGVCHPSTPNYLAATSGAAWGFCVPHPLVIGANVSVTKTVGGLGSIQATSDRNGAFSLSLPPGNYTVKAQARGFLPSSQIVSLPASGTVLSFALSPVPGPAYPVVGTVVGAGRSPLAEATVFANSSTVAVTATSDNLGRFVLDLPVAHYTFSVTAGGYAPTSGQSVNVTGPQTPAQNFVLYGPSASYLVSGALTNAASHQPVPGATLTFAAGSTNFNTVTSATGQFSIPLQNGTYNMTTHALGYVNQSSSVVVNGMALPNQNRAAGAVPSLAISGTVSAPGIPPISQPNLGDLLDARSLSWADFAEGMTTPCNLTANWAHGYNPATNPFPLYQDVAPGSPRCVSHDLPFTAWSSAVAVGNVPNYALITPNATHSGANSSIPTTSQWLDGWLTPLLQQPWFRQSAIFITYTDAPLTGAGSTSGFQVGNTVIKGGNVYFAAVSPFARNGFTFPNATTFYNLLTTVEWLLGLGSLGQNDNGLTFPAMTALFGFPGPPVPLLSVDQELAILAVIVVVAAAAGLWGRARYERGRKIPPPGQPTDATNPAQAQAVSPGSSGPSSSR